MTRLIDIFLTYQEIPTFGALVKSTANMVPTVDLDQEVFRDEFEIFSASMIAEINPRAPVDTNMLISVVQQNSPIRTTLAQMHAFVIICCKVITHQITLKNRDLRIAHSLTVRPFIAFRAPEIIRATDIMNFLSNKSSYAAILKYRFEAGVIHQVENKWSYVTYVLALSRLFLKQDYEIPKTVQYETPLEICAAAQIFGIDGLRGHIDQVVYDKFMQMRATLTHRPLPWLIHPSEVHIEDTPDTFFEHKERLPLATKIMLM